MDPRDASASKNNIYLDYPKITDCIFQQSYLASAAVPVFVVILVELTNTETVVGSPLKAMPQIKEKCFQAHFFGELALPHEKSNI